uniref:Galactosylgalactosylxylosylprotein 3-beta-glucuronosyltransferase n=1 Tax=Syphacia muris TaxID=451379 RepID=A0A0N5ABY0_9BILA
MFGKDIAEKAVLAILLFFIVQLSIFWFNIGRMGDKKLTLEAEIQQLERKKDLLRIDVFDSEKYLYRLQKQIKNLHQSVRDVLPVVEKRKAMPMIHFITPTYYRPTQKADLIRLSQTLCPYFNWLVSSYGCSFFISSAHVPSLHWILVEDAVNKSATVAEILETSGLFYTHLNVETPPNKKLAKNDPDWILPKGVFQRNAALTWLRVNFVGALQGVVYFGDDDNTYELKLFSEMRSVLNVGVWPVGIVGGMLVEAPLVQRGKVVGFNSLWKPKRMFPLDMAAFALNITLILKSNALFTYDVPRGYQETSFLKALSLNRSILEPKANHCTKVLVWHTRTEKVKLVPAESTKFDKRNFSDLEVQAIG